MPFMLQDLGYGTLTSAVEALEECLYLCAFMAPTESLNPGYLHRVIDNAPLPFDECENVLLIHFPPLPPTHDFHNYNASSTVPPGNE